jgi:hypothetical protein
MSCPPGLPAGTFSCSRAPEPASPSASNCQPFSHPPLLSSSSCHRSYPSCAISAPICSAGGVTILLCCINCHACGHRGVRCCYLGSGQTDPSVTAAALAGEYRLVYACPETLVSMQTKLQRMHQVRHTCAGCTVFDYSQPRATPLVATFAVHVIPCVRRTSASRFSQWTKRTA